jgi:hypothetical protein
MPLPIIFNITCAVPVMMREPPDAPPTRRGRGEVMDNEGKQIDKTQGEQLT